MQAKAQKRLAIGVDLGGTNTRVALIDGDFSESTQNVAEKVIELKRAKTPVKEGPAETARVIAELCSELSQTAQKNFGVKPLGVGIGSPGPLSRKTKTIFQTPNLPGFEGYPLGGEVQKLCGLPVLLDNDAKCAAFGEEFFGAAKGLKNFILLTFGTGIGGGVVVDGEMVYGKSDGACEIGHMTLYPEGLQCKCGNRGCFEQYCSATAIERRATAALCSAPNAKGSAANAKDLIEAFDKNEAWAKTCMKEVSRDFAIACASLVNIFDPEAIILGGGVFTTGGGPLPMLIQDEIKSRCFESSQRGLQICPSRLAGNAGILGAASLIFRSMG